MSEKTLHDILSSNVDSNEVKFYNLGAYDELTVGPNGEIVFNTTQSTLPGTLNTTASYAITASYAMNGGGGGKVDSASYAETASYSKTLGASLINDEGGGNARLALVSSDGTYISTISYLTSSLALTASFINGGTF